MNVSARDDKSVDKKSFHYSFDSIIWRILVPILLFELILIYTLPKTVLSDYPLLVSLVDLLEYILPVLGKITSETATHPEVIKSYILFTICLVPVKVWILYRWITKDHASTYRHLVITPLSDKKPVKGENFFTDPLRVENKKAPSYVKRSLFSRLFWSTLILLFTFGSCIVVREIYLSDSVGKYSMNDFDRLVSGGYKAWLNWAVTNLTMASLMLAISFCVLRDYKIFFMNMFKGNKGK